MLDEFEGDHRFQFRAHVCGEFERGDLVKGRHEFVPRHFHQPFLQAHHRATVCGEVPLVYPFDEATGEMFPIDWPAGGPFGSVCGPIGGERIAGP